jgi:SAM-dependent methyltransferase
MTSAPFHVVAPYRSLAADYDDALGVRFFVRVRTAFERLQRRYGFVFRSAADIGCGTGLFACYLARRWRVPVFAVDRSPEMLDRAVQNCRGERITFLQQDLRQLRLPHPVDLITANYDVLNHVVAPSDVRCTFHRIRENLTPGGHFYFDIITPCLGLSARTWASLISPSVRGLVQQLLFWEPDRCLLHINVVNRRFDRSTWNVERHVERAYQPWQMSRWLTEAGFVLRAVHDEATLKSAQHCTPRLLFLVQRT